MRRIIDKNILIPYKNTLMKRCKFLYGLDDSSEVINRLNSINKLYITDERMEDGTVMYYNNTDKSISINSKIINTLDLNYTSLRFDNASDFIKHCFYHELLHAVSDRIRGMGIMPKGTQSYMIPLNEGFTQMIADDVCGYQENKFLGSYNEERIIANIIRSCVGNSTIIESYFGDPEVLKDKLNRIGLTKEFYGTFNYILNNYSKLKRDNNVSKMILDNIFRMIVLNIVIPKYNSLLPSKREKFLSKLIYNISGDEQIKNKVKSYISEYLKYSTDELLNEYKKILNDYKELVFQNDLMNDIHNGKSYSNRVLVRDNGDIVVLGKEQSLLKSRENKEEIYVDLFYSNGYGKELTDKVLESYLKNILSGKVLNINKKSVLQRRILFCGIKNALLKRGYYILNDYEEFNNSTSMKVNCININEKLKFEDYKTLCKEFSICKNRKGKNDYTYSIIYNKTGNELDDINLRKVALYANNWMLSVQDNGKNGINEAYSPKNEIRFENILKVFKTVFVNMDRFDVDTICQFTSDKDIVRRLMSTPIKSEWVFDFIHYASGPSFIKEKKPLSYKEAICGNYVMNRSESEAKEIIRK